MTKAYQSVCGELPDYEGCAFMVRSADEDEAIRMVQDHAEHGHGDSFDREAVKGVLQEVEV